MPGDILTRGFRLRLLPRLKFMAIASAVLVVAAALCISPALADKSILPEFTEPVANATAPIGRDAKLACVVNHLGKHKVAWVKVDTQTILTIHNHVITRNYRIHLTHSDHKSWFLHINNVQESDRGFYMCQINTVPMRSMQGYLEVVVPPNILDNETSSDLVVKEGANVSLTCRASGYPAPHITWQREDSQMISLSSQYDVKVVDGEDLNISRVSRLHMGAYLCIAKNGIPPAVSKRVVLKVHFPPMIWIPHQLVARTIGGDATLECHTEAYPKSINYWTTDKGEMITSGDKYTAVAVDSTYQVQMRLKIHHLEASDFGSYKCIAKNSLGETGGSIKLYEVPASTPVVTTTTDRVNFESKGHLGETRLKVNSVQQSDGNDLKFYKGKKLDSTVDPSMSSSIHTQPRPRADTVNNSSAQLRLLSNAVCLLVQLVVILLA